MQSQETLHLNNPLFIKLLHNKCILVKLYVKVYYFESYLHCLQGIWEVLEINSFYINAWIELWVNIFIYSISQKVGTPIVFL